MLSRLSRLGGVRTGAGAPGLRRVGVSVTAPCATATLKSLFAPSRLTLGAASSFGVGCAPRVGARTFLNSSFLNGANSAYVEEMYLQWRANPSSVHASWDAFFRTGTYTPPPSLVPDYQPSDKAAAPRPAAVQPPSAPALVGEQSGKISEITKLNQLVRAFQVRGHLLADLDPLGLTPPRTSSAELDITTYGFTEADLDREFQLGAVSHIKGFLGVDRGTITLRKLVQRLKETYCGPIGWEFMHIPDVEQCNFLRERIESKEPRKFSREEKLSILDRLTWADHFERFLAKKWPTSKRFGLEGGETTIPGMKALLSRASELGVDTVVIGMPHRGRLNVLSTVMRKPLEAVMSDFHHHDHDHSGEHKMAEGSGDVKYHLGMSIQRPIGKTGKNMHLSLLANPSHLEAVDPVVLGKTRAKQFFKKDADRTKTMGVLLHGDAAFSGQGVVWETFTLSDLPDYTTGGVIHIVVNNQIGFTTDPSVARSTPYCTDIAKAVNAPIFHVNGDDPEAVTHACEVAAEWRQRFGKDVVIDLICYRKHGHNEIDEPKFTQPLMYKKIAAMPSSLDVYRSRLQKEGSVTKDEMDQLSKSCTELLEQKFIASKTYTPKKDEWLAQQWEGIKNTRTFSPIRDTGVPLAKLREIGLKLSTYPSDLAVHPRLAGIYTKKKQTIEAGKGIDWATAEALAFGTLLCEGHHVRLSGQDVERGTFSHRHAVIHDQNDPNRRYYEPLNHLSSDQAYFSVSNSNLSEFAILGFELGYSLENPNSLVLWEAQFGDFANGAQVIIDQFLSAGEDKWLRQSGLVMLLPHGYEGQGPEHSSARLERYLQGSKEHPDVIPDPNNIMQIQRNNWQIVNCTTPANYYHALRRQMHRDFRKPLIVMSPKALLRHADATSSLAEMTDATRFQQVLPDPATDLVAPAAIKRVVFCSGKVYYDLLSHRRKHNIKNVALVRVEQLSPFPFHAVAAEAKKYQKADLLWCQEEPMNMGAWSFVNPRFETALKGNHPVTRLRYVGRAPSASTAAGRLEVHERELAAFLAEAFKL